MTYKSSQVIIVGFKKKTERKRIKDTIKKNMCIALPDKVEKGTQMTIRISYEIEWNGENKE